MIQLRLNWLHRFRKGLHRLRYRLRPTLRHLRRPLGTRPRARRAVRDDLTGAAQCGRSRCVVRVGCTCVYCREGQGDEEAAEGQAGLEDMTHKRERARRLANAMYHTQLQRAWRGVLGARAATDGLDEARAAASANARSIYQRHSAYKARKLMPVVGLI